MSNLFTPVITTKYQLDNQGVPVVAGQIIATTDTHEFYVDIDSNTRKKYSDVEIGTYSSITADEYPLTGKLYFATDTHQLLQAYYESGSSTPTWKVLNDGGETNVVNVTARRWTRITLENNTIYNIIGVAQEIELTPSANMSYCTVCFTAVSSTTFTHIEGSRCIGYDCSDEGRFIPVGGKEYQIAIDYLNNQLTLYVLRLN